LSQTPPNPLVSSSDNFGLLHTTHVRLTCTNCNKGFDVFYVTGQYPGDDIPVPCRECGARNRLGGPVKGPVDLQDVTLKLRFQKWKVSAEAGGLIFATRGPIPDTNTIMEWCISDQGVISADAQRIGEGLGTAMVPFSDRTFEEYRLIKLAMAKDCEYCKGSGLTPSGTTYAGSSEMISCPECEGTGKDLTGILR